jgi:hypothetical protein
MITASAALSNNSTEPRQPLVTILPIFWLRPLLVKGMPVLREMFDLTRVMPISRFHEKPPLFITYDLIIYNIT